MAKTSQREKRERAYLATQAPAPPPQPFTEPTLLEIPCTCNFLGTRDGRPVPHYLSKFDPTTRRRHNGWIPPGFLEK